MARKKKNALSLHQLRENALRILLFSLPFSYIVDGVGVEGAMIGSWSVVILSTLAIWWAEK